MTHRWFASIDLNEPRRSVSVRALSSGGRFFPVAAVRLIPNRASPQMSGLSRSAKKAGTCSVGATFGLYSKFTSGSRVSVRGRSLHSRRPRMRLHILAYGVRARKFGIRAAPDLSEGCYAAQGNPGRAE